MSPSKVKQNNRWDICILSASRLKVNLKGLIKLKNPELVQKLIAELKTCTTNNFELHRVEVLEKDLLEGFPTVEVVDETHQKFNGVTFRKSSGGHFLCGRSIHREVFTYYNGEIPPDYVIHHEDLNKGNNEISNLKMLTNSNHRTLHNESVKRPNKKCPNCGKIFHPRHAINIYCSENCFRESQQKEKTKRLKNCLVCGKEFFAKTKKQLYCSKSCASVIKNNYKRLKEKICPICGKIFKPKRLSRVKTCSRSCALKLAWQKRNNHIREKICPVCRKSFKTYHHRVQICCSHSCAMKFRYSSKNGLLHPLPTKPLQVLLQRL